MCDFLEIFHKGSQVRLRDDPLESGKVPNEPQPQANESTSELDLNSLDVSKDREARQDPTEKKTKILIIKDKVEKEVLIFDEQATINKLRANQTIVDFCSGDLKEKSEFSGRSALLMSNFSFLVKMSIMQVLFVGLSAFPVSCLVGLILVELLYVVANVIPYVKSRHLKSVFMLIPKVSQSAFLLTIEAILLFSCLNIPSPSLPLKANTQLTLSKIFMISNFAEYAVMLLNLYMIVKMFCYERRRKQSDPSFKTYLEQRESFLIYKKPES